MCIYHMPKFIDKYMSIGMYAEQASESIHRVFNKLYDFYIHSASTDKDPHKREQERIKQTMDKQHQLSYGARIAQ